MNKEPRNADPAPVQKPDLELRGILFAFATNVLLTTGADLLVAELPFGFDARILATMVSPLLAGVLTGLYTRERGGMHALIGAALSIPMLAFFVFDGNWQFALLAAAFCTMGAALTEIAIRRRSP